MKTAKPKSAIITLSFMGIYLFATAQGVGSLSLEECYALARQHYPLVRQTELISQTREYTLDNIAKGWLPQVQFGGQATYQSDVTQIPLKLPNIDIESPSRDQYKIYGEINQAVFDGGVMLAQKQLQEINSLTEQQELETELYALRQRINDIFFGILLIDEQVKQVHLLKEEILSGIHTTTGALNNGAALKSSVDVLKAESLKITQREIELQSARNAFLHMLGLFIDKSLGKTTTVEKPQSQALLSTINRPELTLFEYKKKMVAVQDKMIAAKNLPKIGLFLQAGYGRPALNMLKNEFALYYIGGIRLNWSLSGLHTATNERRLLDINRRSLDLQKETFLFNTRMALSQHEEEIVRLRELIRVDHEIISLRTNVKNTAQTQLQNGYTTANDYIREVNAEDLARQQFLFHEIQLLSTQHNYKTKSGN